MKCVQQKERSNYFALVRFIPLLKSYNNSEGVRISGEMELLTSMSHLAVVSTPATT